MYILTYNIYIYIIFFIFLLYAFVNVKGPLIYRGTFDNTNKMHHIYPTILPQIKYTHTIHRTNNLKITTYFVL